MNDRSLLLTSSAGMRLVAQMTFYNAGDEARLRQFLSESYSDELLQQQSADEKTAAFLHMRNIVGRVKVQQVIGAEKHQVVAIMEAEKFKDGFVVELRVGGEYPHKIEYYMQKPVEHEAPEEA